MPPPALRIVGKSAGASEKEKTERKQYVNRWTALKNQRSSHDAHWRDIGKNFRPRRPRFESVSDKENAGSIRNGNIINSTPVRAGNVCAAGMMNGISSAARPWFRLTIPDGELAKTGGVRLWLNLVEERLRMAFARSNLYKALQEVYDDLCVFGTACLFIDEDPDDLIRAYTYAPGQYALALSDTMRVDTMFRETSLTVGQVVRKFGLEKCSGGVQEKYRKGNIDESVLVAHCIEPNLDWGEGRFGAAGMKWRSCWFEVDGREETGFLLRGGYRENPVMAPRWRTTSEDVYGHSPGMDALGDARALQFLENKKLLAVEKVVDPPMVGPEELRTQGGRPSLVPGDVTYIPQMKPGMKFEPAYLVNTAAIEVAEASCRQHELRIKEHFFNDLFLMLAGSDRREITAREVVERHTEKMEQLGPVLENLQDEMLDPLIERAFATLWRRGEIPDPPEELQGQPIRVQHISVLAQAQRLYEAQPIERLAGFIGSVAAVIPEVVDNFNSDRAIAEYGELLGVKADIIRSPDEVAELRASRAEQAQAQAQGEAMLATAKGAKDLSQAQLRPDNALGRIVGNLGGVAGAAGQTVEGEVVG